MSNKNKFDPFCLLGMFVTIVGFWLMVIGAFLMAFRVI